MRITAALPEDLPQLLTFREEAASWLSRLGSDQWSRPYPADRLLTTIEAGTVFMVRDGATTAATITLTPDAEEGLWSADELLEPSMFVNKLTVSRMYAGRDIGAKLLDWAGDRTYHASAKWLRLDAWTTNDALQRYYLRQGFEHVRTVSEGSAVNGGPRVSGWLAQRPARPADHGFVDETTGPATSET
ncbi:GNAT family N-acetyltransferase [Streptomyces sp. H10-C2]|uniref:GNAT family N-acetyltransferase n=1 Tax=unclassified Streptomyces TaxID=2593676 RepID=UPI0024BB50BB|nr:MULTISPECIES: GNAT family N-acetyltransferase [unclassified Streptomyces]MDJ0346342.1 GNAT family N-acetyltransferase [Streptomyces sp. PH10-H1]MDJ0370779.1 GNAT family N-acetyltransferase [Streptomyces sp. H10-C2]